MKAKKKKRGLSIIFNLVHVVLHNTKFSLLVFQLISAGDPTLAWVGVWRTNYIHFNKDQLREGSLTALFKDVLLMEESWEADFVRGTTALGICFAWLELILIIGRYPFQGTVFHSLYCTELYCAPSKAETSASCSTTSSRSSPATWWPCAS